MLGLALALLSTAHAGRDAWEAIYDARLLEAAHGDSRAAVEILDETLAYLEEDAPERGELLYWLGRARYFSGELEGARAALLGALDDPGSRPRAWAFLVRMDARERRVTALPYRESFDSNTGAWVRNWSRSADGELARVDGGGPGGVCLAWTTTIREGEDDFLFMSFGDVPRGPYRVRMFARARRFPAHIRLVLEDEDGQRWSGPTQAVPTTEWMALDVPINVFVQEDDPKSGLRFPASKVHSLSIQDVTAFNASDRGENVILIDDIEVL